MPQVLAIPPGTPWHKPMREIDALKGYYGGSILVIGSGPSACSHVAEINQIKIPKMLCSGGHYPDGLEPMDFVFTSDSFWLHRKFPISAKTVLISRGIIADPHDQIKVCLRTSYHWLKQIKMEFYSGPAAIKMAMYLGFRTVFHCGMDGGLDPRLGIDYSSSLLQIRELTKEYPDWIMPWKFSTTETATSSGSTKPEASGSPTE